MYPGPSAKRFGSKTYEVLKSKDGTHKIARFDDPVHGAAAQFDLLSSKSYTGRTIREAITKWCGGFYASTYLKVLAENSGITADTILTVDMVRNPGFSVPLAKAMALQEAGKPFPLDDAGWLKAHQLAFGVVLEPVAVVAEKPEGKPVFAPDNPLPSPKPETRVAEMKKTSRKWSLIAFVQRWFLKVPVGLGIANEAGSAAGLSLPDIPAIQENLNAAQSVTASMGNLGWIGWGVVLIVALGMVQKFMVEDAEDGRAIPSGGA